MSRIPVLIAMPLQAMFNSGNGKRRADQFEWQMFCAKMSHAGHYCGHPVGPYDKPARSLEILCNHLDFSYVSVICSEPFLKNGRSMSEMDGDMTHSEKPALGKSPASNQRVLAPHGTVRGSSKSGSFWMGL